MTPHAVLGFLLAVVPVTMIPGASFTLLAHRVTQHGAGQGWAVVGGTVTGLYVHAALAAAGLSAVVMGSAELFTAVKLLGAAYLVLLGIWTWRAATAPPRARPARWWSAWMPRSGYVQALLGNVLNMKAASMYLTLAPQFIDPTRSIVVQLLILASAHATFVTVWLLGWTVVLGRARRAIRSGLSRLTRRVAGVVLVALGVRTAVT